MDDRIAKEMYKGCYGSHAKPREVAAWLLRAVKSNIRRCEGGIPRCAIDIWGAPGCGKTSIVKALAAESVEMDGKLLTIRVVDVPLAQIEEMGDILGYPVEEVELERDGEKIWRKAADSVLKPEIEAGWRVTGGKRTTYAPPAWVPTEARPGVILFDDGNRASQRVMKGLMQLVQDYRTISWELPAGWTICFTGNPDNRRNQVTAMDQAQLTRMRHITLEPDAREWAAWATSAGIDRRGIEFVLRYPEMLVGRERTNPRTLAEFFLCLPDYADLTDKAQFADCMRDAHASLDEETAEAFGTFAVRDAELMLEPETILDDPAAAEAKVRTLMGRKEPRVDVLGVALDRLCAFLLDPSYEPKPGHPEAFRKLVGNPGVPRDAVYAAVNRLATASWKHAQVFLNDPGMLKMAMDMFRKD